MYSSGSSDFQNDIYANVGSMALSFTMYSTTFGYGGFTVQPATPGQVQGGFPTIPYLSLEALLYVQQSSNPTTAPAHISGGSTSNQQVIQGQQTIQDNNGNTIYAAGYFPQGITAS